LDYLLIIRAGFVDLSPEGSSIAPASVAFVHNTRDLQRNQLVDGVVRNLVAKVQPSNLSNEQALQVVSEEISIPEVSYFDSVLMGLMALGIMTSAIISIPVRISTYRNNSILKRLLVTPLPIWKYFASEISAHLVLAMVQAAIILAVGVFVFGARVHGNPVWLFFIVPLGSLVFLNIGFILSAWARTPAAASGMGNAVVLPMMFFAGTFFSTTTFPWIFPYLAEALPLTPMLSAMRQVAIDGAPLWETWPQLAILAGWAAGTAVVAAKVFRFS
jgi:ABC-2 type transport system permease protein